MVTEAIVYRKDVPGTDFNYVGIEFSAAYDIDKYCQSFLRFSPDAAQASWLSRGGHALYQSLTVVLPMHNCERQLRSSVIDILELADSTSQSMNLVIVDDGSTDETYESACELARKYPQITVLRQPMRLGLKAALDLVRKRLPVELVVVHDGVSTINAEQLQTFLRANVTNEELVSQSMTSKSEAMESQGSRRFATVRSLHDRMEQAHRKAASFRWIQLEKPLVPRRCQPVVDSEETIVSPVIGAPVSLANIPTSMNTQPLG